MNNAPPIDEGGLPRVLLLEINEDGTVGGSHQALFDLVRYLRDSSVVPVVAFYQDNPFRGRIESLGVEVHVLEADRQRQKEAIRSAGVLGRRFELLRAVLLRYRFLKGMKIDLLHFNNSPFNCVEDWGLACLLAGIPTVANAMGGEAAGRPPLQRFLARRHRVLFAISEYMETLLVDSGLPADRIVRAYLGIDADELRAKIDGTPEEIRAELGVEDGRMIATMVGNIREWKGQHVVLEALAGLGQADRDRLKVLFVGEVSEVAGAYQERLNRMVEASGITGCVEFLGKRDDVANLLTAADFSIHASVRPEPFGLVVVEALALGTPIIAASGGGPAEILMDGSGITFDPTDPPALTRAMERILHDPELRTSLRSKGLSRAGVFTAEAYAKTVESTYSRVLPAIQQD